MYKDSDGKVKRQAAQFRIYAIDDEGKVLEEVVAKSTEVLSAKGALLRILNKDSNRFEVRAVYPYGRTLST